MKVTGEELKKWVEEEVSGIELSVDRDGDIEISADTARNFADYIVDYILGEIGEDDDQQ